MPLPNTSVATSHGVAIRIDGQTIGMIQTWAPAQNRTVTPAYELNPASSGEVVEQVPGNLGGLAITVTRFDLFKSRMEQIWGFEMTMLTDQTNPLEIREKTTHPDGTVVVDVFTGCWFTNLGRNLGAQGDRIINVSASLAYTRKITVL